MASLYRGYPVGGFLAWVTASDGAPARGEGQIAPGVVKLLLDGQQRVTSLYGIIRGRPPEFFEGNAQAFSGLHFNVKQETFEFYAPAKMKGDPHWVDVSDLMQGDGMSRWLEGAHGLGLPNDELVESMQRLQGLLGIKDREFHVEEVTGDDKTVDVVVEIFNRVNSGGTKLSKGDLALARICAAWPDARNELKRCLIKWRNHGFRFELDWFLRSINAVLTGEALFSALRDVTTREFADGLGRAEQGIDTILNLIAGRLGLDHDRVLGARYSFPVMSRLIDQRGWPLSSEDQGRLLFWYVHAMLWGRFAGSTETVLNQDLEALDQGGIDGLIANLRKSRGDLTVRPDDFSGWSLGARVYPMLYLLTRVESARDLGTGLPLSSSMLGRLSRLEVHHIFPKARLYEAEFSRSEVNAVANFCLLSQDTNLRIRDSKPAEYLAEVEQNQPGALASQWIPTDPELWQVENYSSFLDARRELLASAANDFLGRLFDGSVATDPLPATALPVVSEQGADQSEEVDELAGISAWLDSSGYLPGERDFVIADAEDGRELAMVDMAWPQGIAGGYTTPVALLLEPHEQTERELGRIGYRFFVGAEALRSWLETTGGLERESTE